MQPLLHEPSQEMYTCMQTHASLHSQHTISVHAQCNSFRAVRIYGQLQRYGVSSPIVVTLTFCFSMSVVGLLEKKNSGHTVVRDHFW